MALSSRLEKPSPRWGHGPERKEGLSLAVKVDRIARMRPDIVRWLIDQRAEWSRGAASAPLEHDPGVVSCRFRPSRTRDRVQNVLARGIGRKAIRIVDLAQDTNK